jgi:hypothetical protein
MMVPSPRLFDSMLTLSLADSMLRVICELSFADGVGQSPWRYVEESPCEVSGVFGRDVQDEFLSGVLVSGVTCQTKTHIVRLVFRR